MRTPRILVPAALVAAVLLVLPAPGPSEARQGGKQRVPDAYRVSERRQVADGLTHLTLRRRSGAGQVVNVARVSPTSKLRVRPVPSRGNATGRGPMLEPTSRLCRRVGCLIAVNGDFFRGGHAVGGIVVDGRIVKRPRSGWRHAVLDPDRNLEARRMSVDATLLSSDLKRLKVPGVDPLRFRGRRVAIYTPASGRRTPRLARPRTIAVFRTHKPAGPLRLEQTSVARLVGVTRGRRVAIPRRGFVVVARQRPARWLREFRGDVRRGQASRDLLIRLESTPSAWDSIGGRPLLVRGGKVALPRDRSSFARGKHPRTIIGRTRDGSLLLVTVDGRRPGRAGMNLEEAARLMVRLGAVEAMNLDGGGSTTFVRRGAVRNRPSDGRERSVAVALAVVPRSKGLAGPRAPSLSAMTMPAGAGEALRAPTPATDGAAEPAVVPVVVAQQVRTGPWFARAAALITIVVVAVLLRTRLRRRPWGRPAASA